MTAARVKKAFTNIPETLNDAVGFLTEIAQRQKAINTLNKEAKEKIAEIKEQLEKDVSFMRGERDTFFHALFAFAKPRQKELTEKARSIKLSSGTFGWRWTPPSVVLKEGVSPEKAVRSLEMRGLSQYVRVIKEVDKEALLRDRPDISFVTYEQREEFFAKPKLQRGEGSAQELRTETVDV